MSATLDHAVTRTAAFPPSRRKRTDGLTITELAARLTTTVRALRYYEEVGMLHPDRSGGNARCYGPPMRVRAAVIVALRGLGVPLKTIETALDDRAGGLETLCRLCRTQALERLEAVGRLEDMIACIQRPDCG